MAAIVDKAMLWSGAFRRLSIGDPAFFKWLEDHAEHVLNVTTIDTWLTELSEQPHTDCSMTIERCRQVLRVLRKRIFFICLIRDVNGLASLEEITTAMTRLAEIAVQQAYLASANQLRERWGEPIDPLTGLAQEMIIVGMGKLGGSELNVSSDIDLVMLYGEEGETSGPRKLSNHEFYVKLTQTMLPLISEFDADGHVFRTDLRLRPDGDSGPLAWSLSAFEQYLFTQGREWERYAWLKARVIPVKAFKNSQPNDAIVNLEGMRLPFVFRKYFDFDALAALRMLREQIRQDWEKRSLSRQGLDSSSNIKLGDGGIREIEFVVQLTQLIRGGRMPILRDRPLLTALSSQVAAGLMEPGVAEKLNLAYRFLRKTEHMLQYREDAQTHVLPHDPILQQALAAAMGLSTQSFWDTLNAHREFVSAQFKQAFRIAGLTDEITSSPPNPKISISSTDHLTEQLGAIIDRFQDHGEELSARLMQFLDGHRIRSLSLQNRQRLDAILANVLATAVESDQPLATCYRVFDFLDTIAQRSAYLALLAEYPSTVNRVTRMMAASPWAAQYLLRHPVVLDNVISWPNMMEPIDFERVRKALRIDLDTRVLNDGQVDVEQQMNLMRDVLHQVSFQLLAQDLEGILTVERLSDQLSSLADLLVSESIERVWPLVARPGQDGTPERPHFAVIAYGKLGGKELGYSSDLDLVYLYEDSRDVAQEQYAKLSRRLTSWLSTMTSSGRMYDVDLRLRPDGEAGLLAVSVKAFETYEMEHAWVWEHQAITRARFCAGDAQIGDRFEAIRRKILMTQRNAADLKTEILAMREKISAGHPNRSQLFDIKHDAGGMVDLEFVTQYLILLHCREHPELIENLGNISLLKLAANKGLLDATLAENGANSYRELRHRQHILRLAGADKARVAQTDLTVERASIKALWASVFDTNL